MHKINTLLNHNNRQQNTSLSALTQQLGLHQLLQQLWVAACPALLAQMSMVGSLKNQQLTVFAQSPIVAHKIKLIQAKLLTQLQHLHKTVTLFRECKVTAIHVKVQVKSPQKVAVQLPRKLSKQASISLQKLAHELGESALSTKLNSLASKTD